MSIAETAGLRVPIITWYLAIICNWVPYLLDCFFRLVGAWRGFGHQHAWMLGFLSSALFRTLNLLTNDSVMWFLFETIYLHLVLYCVSYFSDIFLFYLVYNGAIFFLFSVTFDLSVGWSWLGSPILRFRSRPHLNWYVSTLGWQLTSDVFFFAFFFHLHEVRPDTLL